MLLLKILCKLWYREEVWKENILSVCTYGVIHGVFTRAVKGRVIEDVLRKTTSYIMIYLIPAFGHDRPQNKTDLSTASSC
jgi:hypothetical protein